MNCPDCDNNKTSIVDTRKTEGGETVRRRRECVQCEFRYTTYERRDWNQLRVKKRDGTTELYDPEKIEKGIQLASEKRPIPSEQVATLTDEITDDLKSRDAEIVASTTIGGLIADRLKTVDKVSFVRFVSVYREYSDPHEFLDTIDGMVDEDIQSAEVDTNQNQ